MAATITKERLLAFYRAGRKSSRKPSGLGSPRSLTGQAFALGVKHRQQSAEFKAFLKAVLA